MEAYIEKSIHTLELPAVLQRLADFAVSQLAKDNAVMLRPLHYPHEICRLIEEVTQACQMIVKKGNPSFYGIKDITPSLSRVERDGVLTMRELLDIATLLRVSRSLRDYRDMHNDNTESILDEYFSVIFCDAAFEKSITDAILSEDEISDNASNSLYTVRRKIKNAQAKVKDILAHILSTQGGKILQETLITQRSGRYVVPVKAEHKAELPGMVHDVSASGATVFIEPLAVVEANNEIAVLQGEEAREIERILAEFSSQVYERSSGLKCSFKTLTSLDLIFAKAKLAFDMEAAPPSINDRGIFVLRRARHPLLPKKTAVPIDISLGERYDTLIITGPNTGGKTVSLKTLGLLTIMANCGLHIPVSDGSSLPVASVFADIGDEQSIEQSLSTFSSHMKNIIEILKCADKHALVLFDELGAGTDPVEGAALAIAIIERAASKGARIAATTHYAELKVYTLNTKGVENASCEFDVETLRPTYRLLTGVPGRSNAFAISKRLGLDDDVIEHARGLVGSEAGKFEDVIDRLEQNRRATEAERLKAEALRREIEELNLRARDRERKYEEEKQKAAARARAEADDIVRRARRESDAILDEVRELRKKMLENAEASIDFNKTGAELGRKFNALENSVSPSLAAEETDAPPSRPIVAGDSVRLLRLSSNGTVITPPDKDGNMLVLAGIIKMNVKVSEVKLLEDVKKKQPSGSVTVSRADVSSAAAANKLDLRGMAADEALLELERFVDMAVRQHMPASTIVHGKGTGKLRDEVRKSLKKNKLVSSFRPGVYGEGEDGVTIVEF